MVERQLDRYDINKVTVTGVGDKRTINVDLTATGRNIPEVLELQGKPIAQQLASLSLESVAAIREETPGSTSSTALGTALQFMTRKNEGWEQKVEAACKEFDTINFTYDNKPLGKGQGRKGFAVMVDDAPRVQQFDPYGRHASTTSAGDESTTVAQDETKVFPQPLRITQEKNVLEADSRRIILRQGEGREDYELAGDFFDKDAMLLVRDDTTQTDDPQLRRTAHELVVLAAQPYCRGGVLTPLANIPLEDWRSELNMATRDAVRDLILRYTRKQDQERLLQQYEEITYRQFMSRTPDRDPVADALSHRKPKREEATAKDRELVGDWVMDIIRRNAQRNLLGVGPDRTNVITKMFFQNASNQVIASEP